MSASPAPPSVPSQKRPLEEPSSDAGPGEQPDAKRPALDSIKSESTANGTSSQLDLASVSKNADTAKLEDTGAGSLTSRPGEDGDTNATSNGLGSSAVSVPESQPIQSTMSIDTTSVSQAHLPNQQQDETGWLHVRAIISSAEAATLIGKGGENVTQIRRMSGAKCTISDYSRGAVERVLTVSGLVDAVAKAFGLIIRTLNVEPLDQPSGTKSKTYPLRLLIPHILIGSIIGQKGARIREIQEQSGARLNASDSTLPLSTERTLVVLGVADSVHIATFYVGSTLVEQLTERFGGPAASAYATRSGGPAGVVPGGMQVVPYVPPPAGGQWGHPDGNRRQQHSQANRQPMNPYATSYGYANYMRSPQPAPHHHQAQPQQPQTPMVYPNSTNNPGIGPRAPQQQGYGQSHMPQQAGHGMPQQGGAAFPGQPLTQQIYIPNDMVGAIIGKGGQKINEIRQLSGSVIKINEPQDNSNERLVTITGTSDCNQMALYLLYQRLESEKHRI